MKSEDGTPEQGEETTGPWALGYPGLDDGIREWPISRPMPPFAFPIEGSQKRLGEFAPEEGTENRKLPVRWADRAMFQAEPIDPQAGPKVYLLWMTPDPLGAIAAACKMYKGEVVRDLADVTDEERIEYFAQIQRTKLKAPFEFVKFHFMIEGVTRAFTHQMVRQRTAVYAQESLRFAVPTGDDRDLPVGLPPSLSGLSETDPARLEWKYAVEAIEGAYSNLVNVHRIPAEDARGLLPTNVLTRLHYSTDLRALLDHAGNRLCTQAQFEWRLVFSRIIEAIREPSITPLGGMKSEHSNGMDSVYMADELTALFKPVCYQTGKCEFKANFDRHCGIRDRVDEYEAAGIPSSLWGNGVRHHERKWVPEVGREFEFEFLDIEPIKPGEWLLNPGAARER